MGIDLNLVDSLLAEHGKRPEEIAGENGWLKELTKAILERALNAELSDHLGYAKHDPAGYKSGNSRNGKTKKTLKGDFGEMELETPRDRNATFEPLIVAKNQTRWTGFDDKILSMYARGMSTRDIEEHLREIYGVNVSPALISAVTDEVQEEVRAWQNHPLDRHQHGGHERSAGALDHGQRRRKVLAAGDDGDQEPRSERCVHRLCGRAEGLPAGD